MRIYCGSLENLGELCVLFAERGVTFTATCPDSDVDEEDFHDYYIITLNFLSKVGIGADL